MGFSGRWPKLVLIAVPIIIVLVGAGTRMYESLQPNTKKAIRLVQESNSRKENFTIQQYLYTTVYHRMDRGEAITIDGWHASVRPGSTEEADVDFVYRDKHGVHVASWSANLTKGSVDAKNDAARDLSWH
ncbi:MAG TPA: hypothetical protein VKM94_10995 [Blastocatellia bacterium]|nr:hypothetical protein [Blastocatellia bacterium]